MKEEAIRLLDALRHEVGGLIIKEATIQAAFGPTTYRCLFPCITALAFLGCHHQCNDVVGLRDELVKLFDLHESAEVKLSSSLAPGLAQATVEINEDFLDTNVVNSITIFIALSIVEDTSQSIFSFQKQTWKKSGNLRILEYPTPHSQLAREFEFDTPPHQASSTVQTLRAFISPKIYPLQHLKMEHGNNISEDPQIEAWNTTHGSASLIVETSSPLTTVSSI
ncbi:hypothetical protein P280DRAFT_535958 [Massarina eburnea CBS 473.64]|uniref:Uncharacterized protein n=1 Tax=Massarina eburnea CBS 473.64 TaxID=1395130 RepID=A0A6A6SBI6_9PLEO|nr:hypothetical protein P280DRAFT_535958 [Massarina eburnea CBS 473.64]